MRLKGFFAIPAAIWCLLYLTGMAGGTVGTRVVREVFLMGTQVYLEITSADRKTGLRDLEGMIRFLQLEEERLSTWKANSRLSLLNRQDVGTPLGLQRDECELFIQLGQWVEQTGGAFDPAVGQLIRAWDLRGRGRVPTAELLDDARGISGFGLLALDQSRCEITRKANVQIDCGAFGKGDALDRMARYADENGLQGWLVSLGGQLMIGEDGGSREVTVSHPEDRSRPLLAVRMDRGSMATSGLSERSRSSAGYRIGHIIDPRTGRPAAFSGAVTVWNRSARSADILSTALFVMGADHGLAWAEQRALAACYLTPKETGEVEIRMTSGFRRLEPRLLEEVGVPSPN